LKKLLTLVATAMFMMAVPQITHAATFLSNVQTAVVTRTVGTVTASPSLNLRKTAITNSEVIAVIPKNTQVDVISKNTSNWYNVTYNGQTGWVSGSYLSVETVAVTAPVPVTELVNHGLNLLGIPYVYGGTTSGGFDCSGYTQYVFKASGISLPRTAAEQFKVGASVSQEQLQVGDLVFFTTYAAGASHVGIYIGGGSFIAASNSGVSISSLSSDYYSSRYLGARRVMTSQPDDVVSVSYQGHIQDIGWQNWVSNGKAAGTEGLALRAEALKIILVNAPVGATIKYQGHVQDVGWQTWQSDGEKVGTNGQGLRLEALKITLENMPGYSVQYQAHVQNVGWQAWVCNGQIAGTVGQALRVEAIRIRIVKN